MSDNPIVCPASIDGDADMGGPPELTPIGELPSNGSSCNGSLNSRSRDGLFRPARPTHDSPANVFMSSSPASLPSGTPSSTPTSPQHRGLQNPINGNHYRNSGCASWASTLARGPTANGADRGTNASSGSHGAAAGNGGTTTTGAATTTGGSAAVPPLSVDYAPSVGTRTPTPAGEIGTPGSAPSLVGEGGYHGQGSAGYRSPQGTFYHPGLPATKLSGEAQPFYPKQRSPQLDRHRSGAGDRFPASPVAASSAGSAGGPANVKGGPYPHQHHPAADGPFYSPLNCAAPPYKPSPRSFPKSGPGAGEDARSSSTTPVSRVLPPVPLGMDGTWQDSPTVSDGGQAREYRHAPPLQLTNDLTGEVIPTPERVVLVDSMSDFAFFEALCEGMLLDAERRRVPSDRYWSLPLAIDTPEGQAVMAAQSDRRREREGQSSAGDTATNASGTKNTASSSYDSDDCCGSTSADAEDFAFTIALDLEGKDLGREGHVCVITLATATTVYAIDMVELPREVLLSERGTAFARVMESPQIVKLMFDCRADCDALFFQYGIRLRGVCDLQVAAGLALSGCESKYLVGMADSFARLGLFRNDERETKANGRKFFDARSGGQGERWEIRPLDPLLLRYCAVDVKHFFEAFYKLRRYVPHSSYWASDRITRVCLGDYDAQSRVNAVSDFRRLRFYVFKDTYCYYDQPQRQYHQHHR